MQSSELGRTKIRDFHRSGKPPIDYIHGDIISLLHTFPFHTVSTLAKPLGVSPSTILYHLGNFLGLKPYHFRCVPYKLTC